MWGMWKVEVLLGFLLVFAQDAQGYSLALFPLVIPRLPFRIVDWLDDLEFIAHNGITCDLVSFILYHMYACVCDGQPGPAFLSVLMRLVITPV